MSKLRTSKTRALALCVWLCLFGLVNSHAQAALDFSSLSEENPQSGISVTEKYVEVLKDGVWKSIYTYEGKRWMAPFRNAYFQQSNSAIDKNDYQSYLISPALTLSDISGNQLTFEYEAALVKGDVKLEMLIIDRNGDTKATIGEIAGVVGSQPGDWKSFSATIPSDLGGIGFIAFATKGTKDNRAQFRVRNINTVAGELPVTITTTQQEIDFGDLNVGEQSYRKDINVLIANFSGNPTAKLTSGNTDEFTVLTDELNPTGGKIGVYFMPKSRGDKNATLTITAGDATATVTLKGKATGGVAPDNPTVELLEDEFFYQFDGNKPSKWQTEGDVTKLEGTDRYNSDSGFGVGIETGGVPGFLSQEIDLSAAGKNVEEGGELECLIHYFTEKSGVPGGPLGLAYHWLDENGDNVQGAEDDFTFNPNVTFGRNKAWGELKFRMVCPAGAAKLVAKVLVAPNSKVRMDDFSVKRLSNKDKTPLVAVLPQYRTIVGEVGVPVEYTVVMQGMHLAADQEPNFGGTNAADVLKLDVEKLPKSGTTEAKLTVTPTKKGAFVGSNAYSLKFGGADPENTGSLMLMAYFKAAGTTPAIALKDGTPVREMKAEPGKTDEQTVEFDINDVITSVDLAVVQEEPGIFTIDKSQFYYSQAVEKLYQGPVKITFKPRKAGEYNATLMLTSVLADTLRIPLKGVCKAAPAGGMAEEFSADQTMDPRFTGEAWRNFHKFDLGYWKLDGKWNAANSVTVNKDGTLYLDEIIANGVNTVTMTPAASAADCKAQYSIDGGGHWTDAASADAEGTFAIGTHRPTFIRFVAGKEVVVNSVLLDANKAADRQQFTKIEDAMIKSADDGALAVVNETFDNLRHTRVLGLGGWQNITVRGERPFYAWHQKNAGQTEVENEVAQISFFRWGTDDSREHETWLISPTLSYKDAGSKVVTFSLRFNNPTQDGQEAFGLYVITEKEGQAKAHYLNLVDYVPEGVTVEPETWYDYRIDLSEIEGLDIDDKFHVAYSFYSPVGGNATSLNFMLDDFTFGRTDLPVITADRNMLNFFFRTGIGTDPQTLSITTERAYAPVTITLVPSMMGAFFKYNTAKLPAEGGDIAIGYKSDDPTTRAAALMIQTRGAAPLMVKLLAQLEGTTGIGDARVDANGAPVPVVTADGIRVSGSYKAFRIFSAAGQLLKQGGSRENISTAGLSCGVVILQLVTDEGTKSFAIQVR